ncbi:hypothetical protein Bca52824_014931 [Brassica carinata]|uniref:UspA domain-containing protein n=1 Tax=Brassica carinata TaxID=52824 RepID=A0A8X7W3Z7_BRACI|nr:hypothetical protein Bca52824_014931 [Brassica carinata]
MTVVISLFNFSVTSHKSVSGKENLIKPYKYLSMKFLGTLIPLSEFSEASVMKKYGVKPDAETLDIANTALITVVMKIYWGDPREKICEAVDHIPLSSLGGLQRMIMGSVSNHVVNNVAWPVTVVKSHH